MNKSETDAFTKAGWRCCIDHLLKPEHPCPICRIEELEGQIKTGDDWDKEQQKLNTLAFDALEAMTTLSNTLAVENKKLEQVYLAGLRMRRTAVVDDDFPEMMGEFDSALEAVENRNDQQ